MSAEAHLLSIARRLLSLGEPGEAMLSYAETIRNKAERHAYLLEAFEHVRRIGALDFQWSEIPVDPRCFLESEAFLGQREEIYPAVRQCYVDLNSGRYLESVLTGGIGVGKSFLAVLTQCYQLYVLACLKSPQRQFGLAPSSEIIIVFQSATLNLAKTADYMRFKSLIEGCRWFSSRFDYNRSMSAEMHFPKRLIVKPLSGATTAALGQNIIGGVIDEMSFMKKVESSKASVDGGEFDQATELYNAIVRRRKSRFLRKGWMPGMLCLVSSKRYPGEFVELKQKEAEDNLRKYGETSIYVYDRRLWEIKPEGTYGSARFKLFTGDPMRKPRVLEPGETVEPEDAHLVMDIPEEFRDEFERDLLSALRDIAGVSTLALHPFCSEPDKVALCFNKVPSILSRQDCNFRITWPMIHPKRFANLTEPRWAHIDLGLTGDSAGVAIGHIPGFVPVDRSSPDGSTVQEMLPLIRFDCILEVKPPPNSEIRFEAIRQLLFKLRELGLPLRWVSLDSFQSADMLQLLAAQGLLVGKVSVDTSTEPYDHAKLAFYDDRVLAPEHPKALSEFVRLERDPKTGKIDHPVGWSKDCSDAMAGVIHGLTMRRELWLRHKVPLGRVPETVLRASARREAEEKRRLDSAKQVPLHSSALKGEEAA